MTSHLCRLLGRGWLRSLFKSIHVSSLGFNSDPKTLWFLRISIVQTPWWLEGKSTFSSCIAEVKLENLVLSAPTKSSKDDSASVEFSWNPPAHILPQYIMDYTLRCYDKAKDAYDVTKRLNNSQTSLTLKGLPADRSYSAYVMFSTAFGKGMQSEVVDFETSGKKGVSLSLSLSTFSLT